MKTYTNEELAAHEQSYRVSLPSALRDFLTDKGAGRYGNIEIYQPETVDGTYRGFFDDPSELFTIYVPFGEKKLEQEMLVYRITDATFASIWHETVPDDWPEEEWLPFDLAALTRLVNGG